MIYDAIGARKYLNQVERQAVYEKIKTLQDIERENFCLILWLTGCRVSEALNIRANSIDLHEHSVVIRTLKRRREGAFRNLPIPAWFSDRLCEQLRSSSIGPSERLWRFSRSTAWSVVKTVMLRAEIEGKLATPKALRHGFAVACIQQGVPLNIVQRWLGHARLETTAIYTDVYGEEERSFARRTWALGKPSSWQQ